MTDAGLVTQAHYTDFPGVWGGLASERRSGVSSFYGFDQQSNTRILASINGNVTDNYLYNAFGEELAVSGTTVNSLRFGGQFGYWRDEAERLYVRRRVLRVDQGRWMSRDPLGFGGGDWNLYRYVGNKFGKYDDPLGERIYSTGPNFPQPPVYYKHCRGINPTSFNLCATGETYPCTDCCQNLATNIKYFKKYLFKILKNITEADKKLITITGQSSKCDLICEKVCRGLNVEGYTSGIISGSLGQKAFFQCLLGSTPKYEKDLENVMNKLLKYLEDQGE